MDWLVPYAGLLLTEHCWDTFFLYHDVFHGPCWMSLISKVLGYMVIMSSLLVKVPQILKIYKAKSGEGLSSTSIYMELTTLTVAISYGYSMQFPFSSYGDTVFLLIQATVVALLVHLYTGQTAQGIGCLSVQSLAVWFLLLSGLATTELIWGLQAAKLPIMVGGKMTQAYKNYQNGSTGQLAAATVFLMLFGSLARVFTSYQETGDSTLIITMVLASTCNFILCAQMIAYWNVSSGSEKKLA